MYMTTKDGISDPEVNIYIWTSGNNFSQTEYTLMHNCKSILFLTDFVEEVKERWKDPS